MLIVSLRRLNSHLSIRSYSATYAIDRYLIHDDDDDEDEFDEYSPGDSAAAGGVGQPTRTLALRRLAASAGERAGYSRVETDSKSQHG
jgi:hypothetical protein